MSMQQRINIPSRAPDKLTLGGRILVLHLLGIALPVQMRRVGKSEVSFLWGPKDLNSTAVKYQTYLSLSLPRHSLS